MPLSAPIVGSAPSFHYELYGFRLQSGFPLPELSPAEAGSFADIAVRYDDVPSDGLPNGERLGPFLAVNPDEFWIEVPRVARYLVRDGREIVVDPVPGIDPESVRAFLLGSCVGALMLQRGFLVLHGNAIQIGDACMICVGPSGAGKSTLAAAMLQRGYTMLGDDVVPVDADGYAQPGLPRIKLWQDTAAQLGISTEGLPRIRPGMEKFSYSVSGRLSERGVPVRWIYILSEWRKNEFALEPIQGMDRFRALRNNTYRVRFVDGLSLRGKHLALCGNLAGRARVATVTRPECGFAIDRLVDLILEDVAAHPDRVG